MKATKLEIQNKLYVECATHEEIDGKLTSDSAKFRKYRSYDESLKYHAILLRDHYKPKITTSKRKKIIKKWARSLQKRGYATDSHYAEKLESIIFDTWHLK